MKASWGDRTATIASRRDLDVVIDDVRRSGQPTMIFLEAEDGTCLVFGVGREESVLTFATPDGESFHSLGVDRYRKGRLRFSCREELTDFFAEMAVPERDALSAADQFLACSDRPTAVPWESD